MKKLTAFTLLCFALVVAALAAPPAPSSSSLLPIPELRTATCDPVRCQKLHGVCECDQFGNCFCVPV